MPTFNERFGENLVWLRKQRGISQKQLAELLETSPTNVNYWEKGKTKPKLQMINKISTVLNVPLSSLMDVDFDKYEVFIQYLKSIDISVTADIESSVSYQDEHDKEGKFVGTSQIVEPKPGATPNYTITCNHEEVALSEAEFQQFQETIKKAVEFELFQRKQK